MMFPVNSATNLQTLSWSSKLTYEYKSYYRKNLYKCKDLVGQVRAWWIYVTEGSAASTLFRVSRIWAGQDFSEV